MVWIRQLPRYIGEVVQIAGWVVHVRSSGKVAFLVIRDGYGLLQCVVAKAEVGPEVWDRFGTLTQETAVQLEGVVRADSRAPGGHELAVRDLQVLGTSPIDYPIQPKEHGIDFLLDHRHSLAPQRPANGDPANQERDRAGHPGLLLRTRFRPCGHADPDRGDRGAKRFVLD